LQQLLAQRVATAPPEPERDNKGRCAKCKGSGKVDDGEFCGCAMGRDMAMIERKSARPEKKPTDSMDAKKTG
jgi:hypothetical protein